MRMIPAEPLITESRAELQVFDHLRAAFAEPSDSGWFAMHSLNLTRHDYKRFGEIDFVVCGPDGLFVLEVKGGGVRCEDGIWETRDRYGTLNRLGESPFKQAEGALHALLRRLPESLARGMSIGFGVITPDVHLPCIGTEWERTTLADQRDCKNFTRWLQSLIAYWRGKGSNATKPGLDAEQLRTLRQFLRPDFEAVRPLHIAVHDAESRIARLTEGQYRLLDIVAANLRVLCEGGAGTGKTMLAMELARRWHSLGLQAALVCQTPWLQRYLQTLAPAGLTVSLASALPVAARRAGVTQFDALIVDEGQDVLNLDALESMDQVLKGGLEAGRWCFFLDVNNQSGLCGTCEPDAHEYLESMHPTHAPLSINCRNTDPILKEIQARLGADLGNATVGAGPAVRTRIATDHADATGQLFEELRDLTDKEGFEPHEIVVLSPLPFARSCAAALPGKTRSSVRPLDSYSAPGTTRSYIGFAEVAQFKGLESEVVVLVDLPRPVIDSPQRTESYVGMSRARALLSMIVT